MMQMCRKEVCLMSSMSLMKARDRLSALVKRAASEKERVVLTVRGRELAALVPIEDLRLLEELEDRLDLDDARAALAEARKEGTVPWEQIKAG